jgi:hypothetical protein
VNDPRYPIGKVQLSGSLPPAARAAAIAQIAELPFRLHDAVRGLDQRQLDTPYRDGGWTLRQVVHHGSSLLLVQALHDRWSACLRALPADAFARTCTHSERGRLSLDDLVALYAWHGAHHVAHITSLRRTAGW